MRHDDELHRAYLLDGGAIRSLSAFQRYVDLLDIQPDAIRNVADAYQLVSWVYRCVRLRCDALGGIPFAITDSSGNEVEFPLLGPDVIAAIEFALCLHGASYVLKVSRGRALIALQWLNPSTVRVEAKPSGIIAFVQGERRFAPDTVIYHRLPNPRDDLGPGVAPAMVALTAARLAWSANAYASRFFSAGAVPAVILSTEQPIPDAEVERVRTVWDRLFGGVRNAFRTAVLRYGLKPTVVGSQFKDLMMGDVLAAARQQIAVAFGIPQTLIEDAANFATAREHKLSFYYETIFPEADRIAHGLNAHLFSALGLTFRFRYEAVEAVQQDEATKAQAIVQLVEAGIISADEARAAMGYEPRTSQVAKPMEEALSPRAIADLWRWKEKALRRGPDVAFVSDSIPDWLYNAIRSRMAVMDARDAFAPALRAYDRGKAERELKRRIEEVYEKHADRIARKAASGEMPSEELDALANEMTGALTAKLSLIMADAALAVGVDIGIGFDYDEILSDAAAWAKQYTYDLIKGIRQTQTEHVQNIISQVLDGKLGREDAVAMIEPMFGPIRAEMIATTEVTRALSQANEWYTRRLRETGHTVQVRWLTEEDEKVCEACQPLDHTLEDVWRTVCPAGPPAHVNCRCKTVIEVVRA